MINKMILAIIKKIKEKIISIGIKRIKNLRSKQFLFQFIN